MISDISFGSESWAKAAMLVPAATAVVGGVAAYAQRGWLLNALYDYVAKGRSHMSGKPYLQGNYAPLDGPHAELFQQNLEIEGVLPPELEGVYMRNGPNPYFEPIKNYHWFDGDGLVHATRIKDGKASYDAHFVRTSKLRQEQAAGKPLFQKLGDMIGQRGLALMIIDKARKLLGVIDISDGEGAGNTALHYHAGRILAVHEGDLPYQLRVLCSGIVETVGRLHLAKKDGVDAGVFTAHPKIDAVTGEMLFLGYHLQVAPFLRMGVMDASGALTRQWAVNLPWSAMMHDMCITEHFLVILHMPLCFDGEAMVKKNTLPFQFRPDRPSRIGLLARNAPGGDATAQVQWFEFPAAVVMHSINAWEDVDGNVNVWLCHFNSIDLDLEAKSEYAKPHVYHLNRKTGKGTLLQLSETHCDFPVVHPALVGRRTRWAWAGLMDPDAREPDFVGIGKLDLSLAVKDATQGTFVEGKDKYMNPVDGMVKRLYFAKGHFGGEAVFVPRDPNAPVTPENEDDGFLLLYVMSEGKPSKLHVYDARTMSEKPLATVVMPQRIPLGFHGTWVTEEQLKHQV